MIKAAIYARYSSDNQREESIDAQIRAMREYASKNNISIIKIYADEAKSATTDNRPQFLQLIKDSKLGLFNVVMVHKLDRFARNRYDSAFYKHQLKMNGIRIISILENLDDSPESIILESVLEGMAEYYSANLAREVMKGMKETALQCKHTGGTPLLGYDVAQDKTYIINEYEKQAVQLIYTLYAQGFGYSYIIDELNKRGFKTKKGKAIGKTSIYEILRNEKYAGVYVFNKTNRQKMGMCIKKDKSPEEIIKIEGGMPQIIEKELWEEVQMKMDKMKHAPGTTSAKEIYLLTGLIFCGNCGGAMVGNRKHAGRNKDLYITYECSTRKRTKQCSAKSINRDYIENLVIEDLIANVLSPEAINSLSQKVYEYALKQQKEIMDDTKIFEKEIKEVQDQINNIVNAIASGMFHPSMKEKMDLLENRKSELTLYLNEAILQAEKYAPKVENIEEYLKKDFNLLDKNKTEIKEIINTYIKKVLVFEDKIEVQYIVDFTNGGGGSRTHVRKYFHKTFSECRTHFLFRIDLRLCPGLSLSYLRLYNLRSKSPLNRSLL